MGNDASSPDRHGLDHDRASLMAGQGWMSQRGCGNIWERARFSTGIVPRQIGIPTLCKRRKGLGRLSARELCPLHHPLIGCFAFCFHLRKQYAIHQPKRQGSLPIL